jgi:hypothetical protein
MKSTLYISIIIFSLTLLFFLFTELLVMSSSHNIPLNTRIYNWICIIVNIAILIFLIVMLKKIRLKSAKNK